MSSEQNPNKRIDTHDHPRWPHKKSDTVTPPLRNRDDVGEKFDQIAKAATKSNKGRNILVGALGLGLAGSAVFGYNAISGGDEKSENTSSATKGPGDWNGNNVPDYLEDANKDGVSDDTQYDEKGVLTDNGVEVIEDLGHNNDLPDNFIDYILENDPALLSIHPNAANIIRSWDERDRAWALYGYIKKYVADGGSGPSAHGALIYFEDNWKELTGYYN